MRVCESEALKEFDLEISSRFKMFQFLVLNGSYML